MSSVGITFAPGLRVGNYELLVELASGGTATVGIAVYRGAAGFERLVVVKRVHRHLTKDRDFMDMLLDEARLASSVRHPNVVPVIDVVRTDDEVVLVMDYVEAVSLSQLVRQAEQAGKRLPIAVVSRIACDTLVGLHEAHEAVDMRRQPLGIVHRDVSPQNVIVGIDGIARVIDFGIAKAKSRIAHTRAGVIKGKIAYMAPEQVDGQPVDRRSDVFAAGVVLWEALTGKRLFRGDDEFDEMRRVMRAPIPPPSSAAPECGPDVDAVLAHALARPVEERFQTARALARALEQAIPPAPARVVGEHVEALCGAELEYRHSRLQSILGDELDKISPRAPQRTSSAHRATAPVLAPAPYEPTQKLVTATPMPPAPAAAVSPRAPTLRSIDGGTETPVESDVAFVPPRRSLTPALVAVTLVSLLLGAGVAAALLSRNGVTVDASATGSAPATASAPATTSAPAPATATATATATTTTTATTTSPPGRRNPPTRAPTPELKSNPYQH
jgi:serine/threonine-protein kinase